MTNTVDGTTTWVLRVDVVKWAIEHLAKKRAHPFFVAYLHLRSRAAEQGHGDAISTDWNDLGRFLEVPGGPPGKQFYRPLSEPPGNPSHYWLNRNLAGSYAPSSVRADMPPMHVVDKAGRGRFSLRPNHAALAREHLLYGGHVSAYPFVAFLYRDFGLVTTGTTPGPGTLVETFRQDWRFAPEDDPNDDFAQLFELDLGYTASEWFEEFPAGAQQEVD